MVHRAITISNHCIANYPAGNPAKERVIYEARRNNFSLRQIVLLIDSHHNTTVVLIIVETATLVILDSRLYFILRHLDKLNFEVKKQ